MNTKIFQQAIKIFFALTLMVGLLVPVSSTSKAAPLAVYSDPTDIQYDANQWSLKDTAYAISAPTAWAITPGSASTIVAVLDTGITVHEDLNSTRILNGYDFITDDLVSNEPTVPVIGGPSEPGRDDNPYDPGDYGPCGDGGASTDSTWQGTHVAGIIGAATNNSNIGIAGIDWNAKILPVRVIGRCGVAAAADVVDGMKWAAGLDVTTPAQRTRSGGLENYPANVIHVSASITPTTACNGYQNDINAIIAEGAVIVAAVGDNNANAVNFPANCDGVIAVASTDSQGKLSSLSNNGAAVDISAPGSSNEEGGVLSTSEDAPQGPEGGHDIYEGTQGTAIAAAHVSGAVSLMFAANPEITPAQVEKILKKTPKAFATGTGTLCTTSTCGSGILDAGKAVEYAERADLVITNAVLSPRVDPSMGESFQVDVTVKNQGGSVSESQINLQIYVDRNPVTTLFVDEADGGHLVVAEGSTEGDLGEFMLDRGDQFVTLPPGEAEARTFFVRINNTVVTNENANMWATTPTAPAWGDGTHDLYVYVDSHGTIIESDEKNNFYSTDNFVSAKPVVTNPFISGSLLYPKHGQNIATDYNPKFKWNKVTSVINGTTIEAEKYELYVAGPSGVILNQWYQASSVCGNDLDDLRTCSVQLGPSLTLGSGTYSWYMRSYSVAGGYTTWSNNSQPTNFTTAALGAAALTYPVQPNASEPYFPVTAIKDIGTTYTPTYTWNKVDTATHYRLYLSGPSGLVLDQWYQAALICDLVTEGVCEVKSPMLGGGEHSWYVQTYGPAGYGPWSNAGQPTKFKTTVTTLGAANLLYPVEPNPGLPAFPITAIKDIGTTYTPTYQWDKVELATYYRLYLSGPGGVIVDQWYQAALICDLVTVGVCEVKSPLLGGGLHQWYVQSYGPSGYGPWSNNGLPMQFRTATAMPGAANLLYPVEPNPGLPAFPITAIKDIGTTYTPTFKWDKVGIATHYRLYLSGPGGVILDQWYQAALICDLVTVGVCEVKSPLLGGGLHQWYVMTYASTGYGSWSNNGLPMQFRTTAAAPGAAVLTYPVEPNPGLPAFPITAIKDIGTTYTPTFKWDKVPAATHYRLYLSGPSGVILDQWYQAALICDLVTVGVCEVKSPLLGGGLHQWYVMTYGSTGYGPWSNNGLPMQFRTATATPGAAVLTYPVEPNPGLPAFPITAIKDIGTTYTPTFKWDKVDLATYYRLYLSGPGGVILDQWYQAALICDLVTVGVCEVKSPLLGGGLHQWYVMTYASTGYGSWSNNGLPMQFTTTTATPGAAVLIDPVSTDPEHPIANIEYEYNPIYKWNKVASATHYRLYLSGPSGAILDQWYQAALICDKNAPNVCEVQSPILGGGLYSWYVMTYGSTGYGLWSNSGLPTQFYTETPTLPKPATNLSPTTGTTTTNHTPEFAWTKTPMVVWYRLYVKGPNGVVYDQWRRSVDVCLGDDCRVSGITLANGDYTWWVQTYSPAGYGPWNSATLKIRPSTP